MDTMIKRWTNSTLAAVVTAAAVFAAGAGSSASEPSLASDAVPATPLVACDPYFSVWSPGKRLTDANTTHWTGKPHRLTSLAMIDGSAAVMPGDRGIKLSAARIMGAEPTGTPALEQSSSKITPTQTRYVFRGQGVELVMTLTTPALPEDVDLLSRPITYLSYSASSTDQKPHQVQIYFEASAELTVNVPDQAVEGETIQPAGLVSLKVGSREQPVLEQRSLPWDRQRNSARHFCTAATCLNLQPGSRSAPTNLQSASHSPAPWRLGPPRRSGWFWRTTISSQSNTWARR